MNDKTPTGRPAFCDETRLPRGYESTFPLGSFCSTLCLASTVMVWPSIFGACCLAVSATFTHLSIRIALRARKESK